MLALPSPSASISSTAAAAMTSGVSEAGSGGGPDTVASSPVAT
jgi:hypothetical protein